MTKVIVACRNYANGRKTVIYKFTNALPPQALVLKQADRRIIIIIVIIIIIIILYDSMPKNEVNWF
jgi:hypothetical protein